MAHFAELDENNKVLNVLVVSNKVAVEDGSVQAENWCNAHLPKTKEGTTWKQTSYNAKFRRRFAGKGCTYDPSRDIFILPKPHDSWVEDLTNKGDWKAPVEWTRGFDDSGYPVDDTQPEMAVEWIEAEQNFEGIEYDLDSSTKTGREFWWNSSTNQWDLKE